MFIEIFTEMLSYTFLSVILLMTLVWGISVYIKRACIVDIMWGLGFVFATLISIFYRIYNGYTVSLIQIQTTICICLWGIRLSYHIGKRFVSKSQEDFRYAKMRSYKPHTFAMRSLFTIFYFQMILMLMIASPIFIILSEQHTYHWIHGAALMIWCFGFYVEWQADRTLTQAKKQGVTLVTHGVWSWSRHPNYMGDACAWWGIALMSYASHLMPLAFISAALMNFLLRKVSGVPLLEKHMQSKLGWDEYCQNTPIFWPSIKNIWKSLSR